MHIGIIPDGNRRYMQEENIDLETAYRKGIDNFYNCLEWCMELGVSEVTLYALSTENIKNRSKEELAVLFTVFEEISKKALNDERIHKNKVRVNICGDMNYLERAINTLNLKSNLMNNLNDLKNSTKDYTKFTLNLAIAYGGRQEVIYAVKKVIEERGEINDKNIEKHLWVKNDADIIIRTGENRMSNFLLWQSAYSEVFFSDKLWPGFEKEDLTGIIDEYNSRERRFGK